MGITLTAPDRPLRYAVTHRNVRHPRLEFKTGRLVVVMPSGRTDAETVVRRHSRWIAEKEGVIARARRAGARLRRQRRGVGEFKRLLARRLARAGGEVRRIHVRRLRTKWASINSRGALTVNTLLRFLPVRIIDYVIGHELTHRAERKHNRRFYSRIENQFPDWRQIENELTAYWFLINGEGEQSSRR